MISHGEFIFFYTMYDDEIPPKTRHPGAAAGVLSVQPLKGNFGALVTSELSAPRLVRMFRANGVEEPRTNGYHLVNDGNNG